MFTVRNDVIGRPNYDVLYKLLKIDEDFEDEFKEIFDACVKIAKPKYMYGEFPVSVNGDSVTVGGNTFTSHIMSVNFKDVNVAWAYVCTCGRELYDMAQGMDDPLNQYWVDTYAERALGIANKQMYAEIMEIAGKTVYSMNPGSLKDFPIDNQAPLFNLLGGVKDYIGAWVTDSFLILPYKSCSGIAFTSDTHFVNCALCPREGCPNRRTRFDESMLNERYGSK